MSVWRDGSDVQRLNAAAGEHPVPVSEEVRDVLSLAREASDLTGGKFDITFGALSDLWKFDHDQDNRIPDRSRGPQAVCRSSTTRRSRSTPAPERRFIARKGMRVHLGGIGKGYAVDRGVAILRRRGLDDFIDPGRRRPLRRRASAAIGPGASPSAIRAGRRTRVSRRSILSNGTFSTSGDYERAFLKDGRRYHHIIDPDRGEPARGCRSVTLVTERAVLADALAKGVFILGPTEGMALIERLPGVEGVIVSDKNEVLVSSGLKDRDAPGPSNRRALKCTTLNRHEVSGT